MSNTQWTTGLCDVVNGSQIVIGTASCDWQNQISANDIFKVNLDGESVYNIGAVSSASKIILSANYTGSTNTGLSYIVGRNFSINRGYYRLSQGDYDFAEILSQDTIDPIDEDINTLFGAYITGSAIGTLASSFAINMDATLCRFWTDNLTSSRNFRLPDQSATLVGLGVEQEFSADQTFNASVWIKGNASIDGALNLDSLNIQTLNASDLNATTGDIDTLHSTTLTVNSLTATTGDVDTLHSAILTANNLNATTGDIETLHSTNFTASEIIASSMKVSDLTNNRIVIAGTSGELEDDANLTWDGSLLTVTGNLTVTGSAVIVTASNLSVKDPLIVLAKDQSGAAAFDAGLIVERGSSQNVGMFWDESADKWVMAYTDETGMTAGNVIIASYGDLRVWDFQAEDLSASNINASAGDISTLHSATFTANDVNATTGDIDTFHSLTFTASNVNASTGNIHTLHTNTLTASTYTAMTRANASIDAIQSNITNINASIAQNASDIVVANASIDALQADKISKTIFNAKGDILTASADDTPSIITVGANNTVLTADSAQIGGLKWSVPAGGGDVAGPATNTDLYIPQWNGVDSKVLKNGFAKSDLVLQPNPILKTANYQILASDNMILASGNITITLASASSKHGIRIGNRSLDANASTLVKKSGGDTIEGNASLNLANKYDTVYLIGDGTNTHFQF